VEFYELGLGEVFPISSANGSGTGELLDEIVTHLKMTVQEIRKMNCRKSPSWDDPMWVNLHS
jgi:predicted GTPase